MIDRIKFRFERMFGHLPVGTSPRSHFTKLKDDNPLLTNIISRQSGDYKTPVWILRFTSCEHRLCDVVFIETEPGNLRLASIDATPAALLRGHNGRVLKSQQDLVLAMTRIDHLVGPLLEPQSRKRLFRLSYSTPSWTITTVELLAQFPDPGREFVEASHLCSCRNFIQKPLIVPGESTTFRSTEMNLKFYAKDLEVKRKNEIRDQLEPVTRIEITFLTNRTLEKGLGQRLNGRAVSTVPFDGILPTLQRSVGDRIVGALDDVEELVSEKLSRRARDIVALHPSPATLHAALHDDCEELGSSPTSRLRKEVFDRLAAECPFSLTQLFKRDVSFLTVDVPNPLVEYTFQTAIMTAGWPTEADPEIAAAFESIHTRAK